MKDLQEIELSIKEDTDGVFAISLVENPAIEKDFIFLSAETLELKVVDEERRIVVGFALVPEKRILRKMEGKEFNVFFTKETISKTAEKYMVNLNLNKFTTEHNEDIQGVSVIESWIVEDPKNDKSNLYKLDPKGGEWVLMSKINNNEIWNQIKTGTFKGYSIEGSFNGFEELHSADETLMKELKKLLKMQQK